MEQWMYGFTQFINANDGAIPIEGTRLNASETLKEHPLAKVQEIDPRATHISDQMYVMAGAIQVGRLSRIHLVDKESTKWIDEYFERDVLSGAS